MLGTIRSHEPPSSDLTERSERYQLTFTIQEASNKAGTLTVAQVEAPDIVEELGVLLTSEDEEEVVVEADGVTVSSERHFPLLRALVHAIRSDAGPVIRR